MAFTSVTCLWQFAGPLGPDAGYVDFSPSVPLLDVSTSEEIAGTTRYTLDSGGWVGAAGGFLLTANDDATTEPRGTYWRAEIHLTGVPVREYALVLYTTDAGVPVLVTARIAATSPSPLYQYTLLSDFLSHVQRIASSTILGHVRIGSGITIDPDGTIHAAPASSSGHVIEDEGTSLPAELRLNFTGSGVTASDNPGTGATDVLIPGSTPPDDSTLATQDPTLGGAVSVLRTVLTNIWNGVLGRLPLAGGVMTGIITHAGLISAGGNARGTLAIDLQQSRTDPTQVASGASSFLGGGSSNLASGSNSVVGAGSGNSALGQNAGVLAGSGNQAKGSNTVVVGGSGNTAGSTFVQWSTVVGGQSNQAPGSQATVVGGNLNTASGISAVVNGGTNNTASGSNSAVAGGDLNLTNSTNAFIGAGHQNTAHGNYSAIAAGYQNTINSSEGFVGAGDTNVINGGYGVICGGSQNTTGTFSGCVIAGGANNRSLNSYAAVGGGNGNQATAPYSTVPGGFQGLAYLYGQTARAAGQFAAVGDSQGSTVITRNTTTTVTPLELFLDGSSQRLVVPAGRVLNLLVQVSARAQDDSAFGVWNLYIAAARSAAGNVVILGTPIITDLAGAPAGWAIGVTADTATQAIKLMATGGAGVTIRWTACVMMSEVS